ncbi:MAG TPA: apolipoprotein N-acyltransferase [bacterium]|nr:apolipoprotein N-acyltransferase [bacterium]
MNKSQYEFISQDRSGSPRQLWRTLAPAFLFFAIISVLLIADPSWRLEVFLIPVFVFTAFVTRRYGWDRGSLLAILSGFWMNLSMPDIQFSAIIFVALIPLFAVSEKADRLWKPVVYGCIACLSCAHFMNGWALNALSRMCEMSRLAIYPLFIGFFFAHLWKFLWFALAAYFNARHLRLPRIIILPTAFAVLELFKLEMYPWPLGLALIEHTRWIQIVDLVGLPGLSFLIVFVNVALFEIGVRVRQKNYRNAVRFAVACLVAIALWGLYGQLRMAQVQQVQIQGTPIQVAVVQPNSPFKVTSDDVDAERHVNESLYSLAHRAVKDVSADLLVFAEAAGSVGYQTNDNPDLCEMYRRIAREIACPIVFDNVHVKRNDHGWTLHRTALLLSPQAEILGEYIKRRLVPFGEYVPFVRQLPFLKRVFPNAAGHLNYQPGTEAPVWSVAGVSIVPQICYEIIYPQLTRSHKTGGSGLIVNISNDAWYGGDKQPQQHFLASVFRCVENRMPMVRVANTGISAYVAASGEVMEPVSPMNEPWVDCRTVMVPQLGSVYRRFGDWFGWLCLVVLLGSGLWRRLQSRS